MVAIVRTGAHEGLDLGAGEFAILALALEYPTCVILLNDGLAQRIAQAAGLTVWGTLKVLLEAKSQSLTGKHCSACQLTRGLWPVETRRYSAVGPGVGR